MTCGRCIKTPPADNASPAVRSTDAWKREGTYEHQFKVGARTKLCRRINLNMEFRGNALSFNRVHSHYKKQLKFVSDSTLDSGYIGIGYTGIPAIPSVFS